MTSNIETQLNKLKGTSPDQAWVMSCRERLLSQIDTDQLSFSKRIGLNLNMGMSRLVYAPVRALVIILLVVFGFSTSFMAKASLPGDFLYPGRIVIEEIEVMLATSPAKKAEVHNKHAEKRLADIQKLSATEVEAKDLQGAIKRLEQDLAAAASSLDIATVEEGQNLDNIAMDITDSVVATIDYLDQTKEDIISQDDHDILNQVLAATANIEDKTLSLLVSMYERDEITAEETLNKFIAIIDSQLLKVSEKVQTLESQTTIMEGADLQNLDWTKVYTDIRQASVLSSQAKQSFDNNDYVQSFSDLTKIKQIISSIEELISTINIEQVL
ncbi:MAG: hypothetical protein AUJ28_01430 [Parcubacteria group bacterium CG1_02_37_51]|uniref:DUF5667 domain-containing protein n=2 Tax=Candidatus Komeiliibacteriota TaxID=1817908 RepID=A0A2M8DQP8_9BACT|nr:MAG: hypothetical protein AUJ28_01430 [Parcubacteria group bacterium CG1_02_37_51]PIY95275.1 MAG: hypothetical protein COY67_00750 [Candidatus Komeilibacteria bacterium CG_4_10_14_0_8_um_filter_37_78]PJC01519.1 MAG: hypothetical protein CO073_03400 [Candidatus Komeilibacteria bacterium CG_4_9_14_0_8_um_filter_36_9]